MLNYWTRSDQDALEYYYYCTSTADRNQAVNKTLHRPIYEICRRALSSLRMKATDERVSDLVFHIIGKVLPKLSESKLKGAFQYIYTSARNYSITYFGKPVHDPVDIDSISPTSVHVEYITSSTGPELDALEEIEEIHKRVIDEIDFRLKAQQVVNITNSVFLLLLKQYLIDNGFDCRGFADYAMEAMHLKLGSFRTVSARLGFKTMQFTEKLIGPGKNKV